MSLIYYCPKKTGLRTVPFITIRKHWFTGSESHLLLSGKTGLPEVSLIYYCPERLVYRKFVSFITARKDWCTQSKSHLLLFGKTGLPEVSLIYY